MTNGPLAIAMLSHLASLRAPSGAERSLALLAEGLAARGHTVSVLAPGPWALEGSLARAGITVVRASSRMCWLAQSDPQPAVLSALRWLRFACPDPGAGAFARALGRLRPDVVHVNAIPHVRGAGAARRAGVPVVWHVREILPAGPRRRWLAKRLVASADVVVAVSEAVAAWLREEGVGDRVKVVHNGVPAVPTGRMDPDEARRRLGLGGDGCLVGLLGQLLPHKGAIEFVEAVARALRVEPSLRWVMAGDGPASFVAAVDRAVAAAGIAPFGRRITGRDDVGTIYAALDALVLTTRSPDPLPRTILEAMAWAKPVAAFRSGGAAEMVVEGETGYLCAMGDVGALADRLVRLARDADLRRRLGASGAARAHAEFSVERHVDRMESILRESARR